MEEHEPIATSQNMLGIIGYVNGSPRQQDLTFFMRACRTDAVDATFRVAPLNGGVYDASHPTDEANMDIQYAEAMVFPTLVLFSCSSSSFSSSSSSSSGDVPFSPLSLHLVRAALHLSSASSTPDSHEFAGPCVTSVGGTIDFELEVAATFSGGGFSLHFPRESFLDDVVSAFLEEFENDYGGLYK